MSSVMTASSFASHVSSPATPAAVPAARRYIYCVVSGECPVASFGPVGIGPDRPEVFPVAHGAVAAVVSATDTEKFEISRANVLDHQRVMEKVMEAGCAVLPVKFNTIAEPRPGESAQDRIVRCVLGPRQEELAALLATMSARAEIGVKGLWPDMKGVFQNLAAGSREIDQLRRKLGGAGGDGPRLKGAGAVAQQMRLGEMVKKALEARKAALEKELISCLSPHAVDWKTNKTFGDPMFVNLAVLVDKAAMPRLESALLAFEDAQAGSGEGAAVRLRFVGPVPPSNFVELVITWDE